MALGSYVVMESLFVWMYFSSDPEMLGEHAIRDAILLPIVTWLVMLIAVWLCIQSIRHNEAEVERLFGQEAQDDTD